MTFSNQFNYNCKVTLDTNEVYLVDANWLHNTKKDYWKGWHCDAGATRILIDNNLDVYSGQCRNDYLGNIKTGWKLLNSSATCKQERCTGCADDLMVKKFRGE